MKAALYIRVSTAMQVDKDSLSTQETILRKYAESHGFEPVLYKEAGKSAKDLDRPVLQKLKRDAKAAKFGAVLVVRLDRITRSNRDLWHLIEFLDECNVTFISTTENFDTRGPTGRFMLNMLASLAQMERETVAVRVSESMYARADAGKWNGGPVPFGYTTQQRVLKESNDTDMAVKNCPIEKVLYIDPNEAKIVRAIYQHYLKSNSIRGTVHYLNSHGFRTRNNKLFAGSTVHRILTNPMYIGKLTYGKRTTDINTGKLKKGAGSRLVDGAHEPIISDQTFDEVAVMIGSTEKKPTRAKRVYLLTNLVRCGKCGGRMYGYTMTKDDKEYFYYRCNEHIAKGKSACEGLSLPGDAVEAEIVSHLTALSTDKHFLQDKAKLIQKYEAYKRTKTDDSVDEMKRLAAEQKDIQKRMDTLLDKLETNTIPDEVFKPRFDALQKRFEKVSSIMQQSKLETDSAAVLSNQLESAYELFSSFASDFALLDREGQANLLRTIVKEIVLNTDKIDISVFVDFDEVSQTDRDSWRPPACSGWERSPWPRRGKW